MTYDPVNEPKIPVRLIRKALALEKSSLRRVRHICISYVEKRAIRLRENALDCFAKTLEDETGTPIRKHRRPK